MTSEIAIREADYAVLKALPSDGVREAAMRIMAADLGIPASFVDDPQTALMATTAIMKALNMRLTYGAVPGIHIHAVPRKSKIKRPNGREEWVESFQIQDGEKLWKDSMSRHARMEGFQWAFSDKPMNRQEIEEYCRSIGYTDEIPGNAAGIFSCVKTSHHVALGVEPMKVAGVWFGKVKQGYKWFSDNLPTGTSPQDVAMRRAHKRAIMASEYPLIPLTDSSPDERKNEFVDEMTRRVGDNDKAAAMFVPAIDDMVGMDEDEVVDVNFYHVDGSNAARSTDNHPFDEPAPKAQAAPPAQYPPKCANFIEKVTAQFQAGGKEASFKSYGFLAGLIDDLTDGKHGMVLSVLCGQVVTSEAPPPQAVVTKLINYINPKTAKRLEDGRTYAKDENGKTIYVDNPDYNQAVVDCIKRIAA